jgi:hypothetical protein
MPIAFSHFAVLDSDADIVYVPPAELDEENMLSLPDMTARVEARSDV